MRHLHRSEHSFWAIYALARDTWTVFASIYASLTFNALLLLAVRCLVVIPFFSKGSQLVCGYCGSVGWKNAQRSVLLDHATGGL
jgi:hypothetical protein